jgi:hypothetical protein
MMFRGSVVTHASVNRIYAEGATALASALERNSTLQHLDVRGGWQRVRDVMLTLVMGCVVESRVFCVVMCGDDASGNSIGAGGATALASALQKNSTLQHLDVSCVGPFEKDIGDDGATALALALERNSTLRHLDVRGWWRIIIVVCIAREALCFVVLWVRS